MFVHQRMRQLPFFIIWLCVVNVYHPRNSKQMTYFLCHLLSLDCVGTSQPDLPGVCSLCVVIEHIGVLPGPNLSQSIVDVLFSMNQEVARKANPSTWVWDRSRLLTHSHSPVVRSPGILLCSGTNCVETSPGLLSIGLTPTYLFFQADSYSFGIVLPGFEGKLGVGHGPMATNSVILGDSQKPRPTKTTIAVTGPRSTLLWLLPAMVLLVA